MSDAWTVNVGGQSYGPYTAAQMEAFFSEGRLIAQSLIARQGEANIRPAASEPAFAAFFKTAKPEKKTLAPQPAQSEPATIQTDAPVAVHKFGRNDDDKRPAEPSHYLIVADMKSRSITGLEEEIFNLGPAYPLLPQVWLVSCQLSVNAIRNLLIQKLGKLDLLFIINATQDKAAWFNFGPEADSRLRRIWMRGHEETANKTRHTA